MAQIIRQIYLGNGVTDFLQYIIDRDATTTTLIICSTRESFLRQLYTTACTNENANASDHEFLAQTISLLSKSSKIKVVYCPTVENLRAYLAVLPPFSSSSQEVVAEKQSMNRPLIAILGPLALHSPTSEFSAQGLSRTLASAVETASREGMDLILSERADATGSAVGDRGKALWHTNVPLLSSSVRRGEGSWLGRSVPVERVAQRWFEFYEPVQSEAA
ncbi:hypothetical protein BDV25DRAFT_51475 [Aspergillus avenaceus]|uniref:Uncharacterized protein n=1 Tax=Aspergillus avenaceus TaxID=36643 RepID=A0A5N6TJ67_ASPAV|nr:hypothetical protein BDV25DRAFT_51475 [Aspergillus avenaceus]